VVVVEDPVKFATWNAPRGRFDVVSTVAFVMDSYVIAFVPVTPDVPLTNPDVL
jgi:hypothetical protein